MYQALLVFALLALSASAPLSARNARTSGSFPTMQRTLTPSLSNDEVVDTLGAGYSFFKKQQIEARPVSEQRAALSAPQGSDDSANQYAGYAQSSALDQRSVLRNAGSSYGQDTTFVTPATPVIRASSGYGQQQQLPVFQQQQRIPQQQQILSDNTGYGQQQPVGAPVSSGYGQQQQLPVFPQQQQQRIPQQQQVLSDNTGYGQQQQIPQQQQQIPQQQQVLSDNTGYGQQQPLGSPVSSGYGQQQQLPVLPQQQQQQQIPQQQQVLSDNTGYGQQQPLGSPMISGYGQQQDLSQQQQQFSMRPLQQQSFGQQLGRSTMGLRRSMYQQ